MRIQQITTNNNLSFLQKPNVDSAKKISKEIVSFGEDFVMGFSDSVSKERRNFIREHYDSWKMPYQSIYETQGRKSEYEMSKLLQTLTGKRKPKVEPKKIDAKKIFDTHIYNLRFVGENSFAGQTLVNYPMLLPNLKKAGIERVVDLVGFNNYKSYSENAGLEYFCFPMDDYIWNNDAFKTKDDVVRTAKREACIWGYDEEMSDENLRHSLKIHELKKRELIDKFVEFIQFMQKDYFYIGCEFGTYKTDDALLLNTLFNPKFAHLPLNIDGLFKIELLENLYRNFSQEDKKKMGWAEEFENGIMPRIEDAIDKY